MNRIDHLIMLIQSFSESKESLNHLINYVERDFPN